MKESPRVAQANHFINVDFLQNESFLRLLFSYVGDVKSLVRASQVNKHWHSVIQKDEALWESISRYYGHCKYPEETWRDFVQEMYCPINTSSPIQLPLSLECAVCARRNRALKQQDPKEYQSKLCSLDLSKEDSKPAAACVHCSHYVEDHIIHMEYRETQVERAVQAHDDGDFKKKVMLVSSIIRVSGGRLRTLEKNLFKSSISFYAHYLTDSMRRTEQSSKYKSYLSELLLLSKKINRLLDEYLIPFATLDNLPSLLEIKALYLEYIAKYSQVTKEEISAKDSANHLRKILLVPSQFPLQYTLYCKDVLGNLMRAYRVARLVKDPVLELKEIIEKIEESRVIHRMKCERIRYQGYLRRKDNLLLSAASSSSAAISAVAPPGSPAPPLAIPPTPAVSVDQDQLSMPLWVIFGYWDSQKCMFIYKNTESDEALEIIFLNRFPVVFTVSTDTEHCWLQIQSSSGQMYELKATNAKERTEWCHALLE